MANSTDLYIDANLDLRELALLLLPEIAPQEKITLESAPTKVLQYIFYADGFRPAVYLSENQNTFHIKTETSIYRYKLSALRGPQVDFIMATYNRLLQYDCFPLAFQESEGETDLTFMPVGYSPDYSLVITPQP